MKEVTKPLVMPQVNLNGTSREQLVAQLVEVTRALTAAYEAMAEAYPHGRDYQLVSGEYRNARDAWHERMVAIHLLKKDIEVQALKIQGEGGK